MQMQKLSEIVIKTKGDKINKAVPCIFEKTLQLEMIL